MAVRKGLRAVEADETRGKKAMSSVAQAVDEGDQRDQLVAMRSRIARAIDDPNIRGADLAALSRRLLEVGKEIDAIDARSAEEAREGVEVPDEAWSDEAV